MLKIKKERKNKEKGFVVLIAIVVSSLLVSIGIFIANVAYKELILSSSIKSTQRAFYAVDTAIECAMYQDIRVEEFRTNISDTEYPDFIICNDDENTSEINKLYLVPSLSNSYEDGAISVFEGSLADNLNNGTEEKKSPYVRLKITKEFIGTANDKTIIEAWGHNKKEGLNIVERGMKVVY